MQLGARWRAGEAPHHSVPAALHDDIERAESLLPEAGWWTLTWLENRPRCELDGHLRVVLDVSGSSRLEDLSRTSTSDLGYDDADDDWLTE